MDNRHFSITSVDKTDFTLAMQLAMSDNKSVIGYNIHKNTLILYWTDSSKMIKLPYKMDVSETINFVWGWFDKNEPTGNESDTDGHSRKGFHIFNESWGHINDEWQAFVAIEPIWAVFGK